jgi:hypothetical protein
MLDPYSVILLLLVLLLILLILYLLNNKSHTNTQTSLPNTGLYSSINTAEALANPISLPVYNSPISTATRHPVGTYALSSLPPYTQQQLLSNTELITLQNFKLPPTFDSRQSWPGLISGPYDQLDCGSCWAFSTALVFSDRLRIQYRPKELLRRFYYQPSDSSPKSYSVINNISPYQLIFCNLCTNRDISQNLVPICNYGCSGGVILNAFEYLVKRGGNSILTTFPQPALPSQSSTFVCDFTYSQPIYRGKYKFLVTLPTDTDDIRQKKIKEELYVNGPVSAAFTVYSSFYDFFKQNPTGIYTTFEGNFVGGHAVSIIGWGVENNLEYWIVRNSWGVEWGDGGYFKIQYNWRPGSNAQPDPNGFPLIGIMDEVAGIHV